MDNLRAAAGWALDAAALDDVAVGVGILARLTGEAFYRPSLGILAWATAGVARVDELDAAHRPVVLGLAAYDAFLQGQLERAAALGGRAIAEADTCSPALNAVGLSTLAGGDPAGAMAIVTEGRSYLDPGGRTTGRPFT